MFLFSFLKKVPENGLGSTYIHTFKENKQNFLTSIIVGLKIYDHIKTKRKWSACIRELWQSDTWENKMKITIDQPQILYIQKNWVTKYSRDCSQNSSLGISKKYIVQYIFSEIKIHFT